MLGLVLLVLLISYASSLRAWVDQREQISQTRASIASTQDRVDDLRREQRRWEDDAYVEQQARARLAFVMPGETAYRVIAPDGETIGAEPEPGEQPSADAAWYDTLWASSRRAGRGR